MEESVEQLQYISVVAKVCTELQNHVGINDKDLAEFITHLARKSKTPENFRSKLQKNGADFAEGFCHTLYEMILRMLPAKQKKKEA